MVPRQRKVRPAHRQPEFENSLAVRRLAGDDRNSQLVLEPRHPQVEPGSRRQVHHVQHQDHRPAEIEHLVDQIKIPFEIRGIDNADDAIGLRRVDAPAEQHVADDRFVG